MRKSTTALLLPMLSAIVAATVTVFVLTAWKSHVRRAVEGVGVARASDHQDGDFAGKTPDVDLTDHFMFREDTATNVAGDIANLILAQTSNPTSDFTTAGDTLFNTKALYEIHVSRVLASDRIKLATGTSDVVFQFRFSGTAAPQTVTLTVLDSGAELFSAATGTSGAFQTTVRGAAAKTNVATTSKGVISFFAGLRKDPTAWDRARFLALRNYAIARWIDGNNAATLANDCAGGGAPINAGTTANFFNPAACPPPNAFDQKNVNAIIVRVPIALLQNSSQETTFDSWSTISLPTELVQGLDDAR